MLVKTKRGKVIAIAVAVIVFVIFSFVMQHYQDSQSPLIYTTDQDSGLTFNHHENMTLDEYNSHLEKVERSKALSQRLIEHSEKEIALADGLLKAVDDEKAGLLSLLALAPPDEIEKARQEALLNFPKHEVDDFFDGIESADRKSIETINFELGEVLSFQETYQRLYDELGVEFEAIKQELRRLHHEP